ncbi:hypothetical protein KIN20_019100 [Parelaphostrongylus tenuis]|uniref:SLED domain-containing protein n=1 Tax=Parelaphostrongylus tenuis TaxID=148309 RepID=A0AAD5MKW3_PARTN|nr:hypothetical protein KIN20_019100 [Parelaphostrongylus tenuis]
MPLSSTSTISLSSTSTMSLLPPSSLALNSSNSEGPHDFVLLFVEKVPLKERLSIPVTVYVNHSCNLGPHLNSMMVAGIRRKFGPYATHHTLREAVQQLLNCSTDDSAVLNMIQPSEFTQILSVTVVASSQPMKEWTIDKVASELRKLLDPATATKFVEQQIDGRSLGLLTKDLLMTHMGLALETALKVVDFVQSVRKVQERQHSSNGTGEAHVPKKEDEKISSVWLSNV